MKTPDTKTILNITLIIGIIIVGKKVLEKLGILDDKDDKTAKDLETASGGDISDTSSSAPVGLALNPNYYKSILASINKGLQSKNKPKLTGAQIISLLRFAPDLPNAKITFKGLIYSSPLESIKKSQLIELQKKRPTTQWENTYLFEAFKIKEAKGFFVDNPEIVNNAFQQLKSKLQISYLASMFALYYNEDLQSYLATFLDSAELSKISNIIKNKKLA